MPNSRRPIPVKAPHLVVFNGDRSLAELLARLLSGESEAEAQRKKMLGFHHQKWEVHQGKWGFHQEKWEIPPQKWWISPRNMWSLRTSKWWIWGMKHG